MSWKIILDVATAILALILFFYICIGLWKRDTNFYSELQITTIESLSLDVYFTVMDNYKGMYVINIMKRLSKDELAPTDDFLLLKTEKELVPKSVAYQVYETMLNRKRRYVTEIKLKLVA